MKMFAKFVKKQNKNGIKIIRAPVGEVENNWLKKQFYHHSDHVLKNLDKHWRNGTPLTIDEKKERLWHLIRDVQKYAYSKGYQTGYERGLVKAQQIKNEVNL
jgi:hypothetical protein